MRKFIFIFVLIFLVPNIEKDLWESGDFVIIISVAIGAIIFIVILIACLVYLKVKGEKMSKVEKFKPTKN